MDFRSTVGLSLAFSMMLSSAFLSAAPEGVITATSGPAFTALTAAAEKHGIAPIQLAQAPASTPASAASEGLKINFLTESQIEKLIKFSERRKATVNVDAEAAPRLRLEEASNLKGIVFKLGETTYWFARINNDRAFLFGFDSDSESRIYRFERDARFVAAVGRKSQQPPQTIPFGDAIPDAQLQVAIWSNAANGLKD